MSLPAPENSLSEPEIRSSIADRVAAVVVNHEAGEALVECVRTLRAEGISEVIVVDNASSDGSTEALVVADGAVRLVQTGTNLGYGAAANRGIEASGSELVLVSNPDVVVHRGALAALVEVLGADPTLAIVGPRMLELDGTRYYQPNSRLVNLRNSGPWSNLPLDKYFGELNQGFSTEMGASSIQIGRAHV